MTKQHEQLIVATAAVWKDDKLLISQRKPTSYFEANKWELPGGKVDLFEVPALTIVRELKEELNVDIKVEEVFDVSSVEFESDIKKVHIVLICFKSKYTGGELKPLDAQDCKWEEVQNLDKYTFTKGSDKAVRKILEELLI